MQIPPAIEVKYFLGYNEVAATQALAIIRETLPLLDDDKFYTELNLRGRLGFLALRSPEEAVGLAIASIDTEMYHGTTEAKLEFLGIARTEHRKDIVGSFVLAHVELAAYRHGKRQVSLDASSQSQAAIDFYIRNSYRWLDPHQKTMRKDLKFRYVANEMVAGQRPK